MCASSHKSAVDPKSTSNDEEMRVASGAPTQSALAHGEGSYSAARLTAWRDRALRMIHPISTTKAA